MTNNIKGGIINMRKVQDIIKTDQTGSQDRACRQENIVIIFNQIENSMDGLRKISDKAEEKLVN